MKCRHCNRMPVSRPRGLCWACYYTPGVRERYQSLSKYGCRGYPDRRAGPATSATGAGPGSPGKVDVLCERARAGEDLWHPRDAGLDLR